MADFRALGVEGTGIVVKACSFALGILKRSLLYVYPRNSILSVASWISDGFNLNPPEVSSDRALSKSLR